MSKEDNLQQKTVKGLAWSFIEIMANYGIQFIVMIILARLLSPEHFGLLGMIMIFIALSQTLIDSGFSQALIREQSVSKIDYSTVFIFNLIFSVIIFLLIYFIAPLVSYFYSEPRLISILRVLGVVVFFQAISIVPRTMLTRNVDFKSQTKVSVIASTVSGVISISMAFAGYGVWSLVFRIVIQHVVQSIMFIYINKWKPDFEFNLVSFKRFYSFGWRLLVSSLIDTFYKNIYYVIIGKMYSKTSLGYYTNSRQVRDAINQGFTRSIQRVTYPVLSSIKAKDEQLKSGFEKVIRLTAYIFFPMMIGIAAISDNLIVLLMGTKWKPAVIYFQLLCVASILYPMHAINLNILKVKGRSDLFLRLEIIKKILSTVAIIITILLDLGVASFIIATIITSHLGLIINTFYSGKELGYGIIEQVGDMLPSYIISFIMGAIVLIFGSIINLHSTVIILLQIFLGVCIYIILSKLFKLKEFNEFLNLVKSFTFKRVDGSR